MKLNSDEVAVQIIHRGVGAITENRCQLGRRFRRLDYRLHGPSNQKARETGRSRNVEDSNLSHHLRRYQRREGRPGRHAGAADQREAHGDVEVRQVFKVSKWGRLRVAMFNRAKSNAAIACG